MLETTEDRTEFETALGRRLVADGRIDAASLERAGRLCVESGERLERVLTKLGMVTERDLAVALAGELGIGLAQSHDIPDHKVVKLSLAICGSVDDGYVVRQIAKSLDECLNEAAIDLACCHCANVGGQSCCY